MMPFDRNSTVAKEKQNRSKSDFSPERFLQDINNLLSAPLPFDLLTSEEDAAQFCAICPWCYTESMHSFVGKGILLKGIFKCVGCTEQTTRCLNFSTCASASKVAPFWEEAFCDRCESRSEPSNTDLSSAVSGLRRRSWRGSGSPLSIALSPGAARRGRALTRPAFGTTNQVEPVDASSTEEEDEHESTDDDDDDDQQKEDEDEGGEWIAVRDALLHWPVAEERAEAECRRDLVSHRVWVRRWLLQYPGDGALAARKILAHLRWRREYRLDTIMDEVRCT
jgi:hypothetical protein